MSDDHGDFARVPHTGGKVTFTIRVENGQKAYSFGYEHANATQATICGAWALVPQGAAVTMLAMGGIGAAFDPPRPDPSCISVIIASDSEGMFGRSCPACSRYFRANVTPVKEPTTCPYCSHRAATHLFFTEAQSKYIRAYVDKFLEAFTAEQSVTIDLDALASETAVDTPPLYYTEERQQTRIQCASCHAVTDIAGLYGYCSICGIRNSLQVFEQQLDAIQDRVQNPRYKSQQREQRDAEWREIVKQCVSHFEGFAADLISQLKREPMTSIRRNKIEAISFHWPIGAAEEILNLFGIDLLIGINATEKDFIKLRFLRRHVYEHNSGVADEKYVQESGGDVQAGHRIRETSGNAGTIIRLVRQMAQNFHQGFHSRS